MLSVAKLTAPLYFLNMAGDYYQNRLEPAGQWLGEGSAAAGLTGIVGKEAFLALAAGRAPDGRDLVQNAGAKNRQTGWDLTFSADKHVSVLWSQASPAVRLEIEAAHTAAVQASLQHFEARFAFTRRGKGGTTWERARIVAAAFTHSSSRALDPQLHTHLLMLNLAVRHDGTVGTLVSIPMYAQKMLLGALYRAELACQLQRRLGLELERTGPFFSIAGIPRALIRRFSTRRREIEAAAGERDIYSAAGMDAVTLATRRAKRALAREALFSRWEAVGAEFGFTAQEVHALVGRVRDITPQDPHALFEAASQSILQRESYFSRATLLRYAAELAPGSGLGIAALEAGAERFLTQNSDIVTIREDRYTTLAVARTEQEMLDRAQELQQESRHILSGRTVERAIQVTEAEESRRNGAPFALSKEQREALDHLTAQKGDLKLLSGIAGAGKTVLLDAARRAWEAEGFTVIGAAMAGKTARGLEDGSGIPSMTLARLFKHLEGTATDDWRHHLRQVGRAAIGKSTWTLPERTTLDRNTVLVLDEAGMVGTQMLAALLEIVQRVGAKLVLVGDPDQLQSIDAGGPFRALLERIGGKRLTEIWRQNEEWGREAVRQFARGKAGAALSEFVQRGLLHVAPTRFAAIERLMADWANVAVTRPEGALIFTTTRSERALMNRMAQEARIRAGQLSLIPVGVNGTSFYAGDRILFTQNSRKYGVDNGTMGIVEAADPWRRTLQVRLDASKGKEARWVTFSVEDYDAIDLGYAITTHKGQGVTVDRSFLLAGGPMQDREMTYVQASRAREETRIYCDAFEAGPDLVTLTRAMSRSRPKELAIAPQGRETRPAL